jgi:hypothetical protein
MSATLARQKEEAFKRFLGVPDPQLQGARSAATVGAPHFVLRLIRRNANGKPNLDDLWAVAYLSHHNKRIRLANPDMTPEMRLGVYGIWYEANPNSILMLERIPADENGISIIGSSIILPLKQDLFSLIESGGLPVVKLGDRICRAGADFDVLLFDTWVMHEDYQDFDGRLFGGPKKHHGHGNALPLRHLALFWKPSDRRPLRVYAEPDSDSMNRLLDRICFQRKAQTAIGQPLLEIQYPPPGPATAETLLDRLRLEEVAAKIEACASWALG